MYEIEEKGGFYMPTKSRMMIRILAGGYLIYLGFDLMKGVLEGSSSNIMLFMLIGIAFIGIGLFLMINSGLVLYKKDYEDEQEEEPEEDEWVDSDEKNDK